MNQNYVDGVDKTKFKRNRRGQKIRNTLKNFTVMYLNMRDLNSKFDSLLVKIEELKYRTKDNEE